MVETIPVTLITGFLGSGKTTLVNRLLASPSVGIAAVVINEFGEISIDHALVRGSRGGIVTLENGCICCSVRGELADALTNLLVERAAKTVPAFDRVLIETTGIASPAGIIDLIVTSPVLAARFHLDRVVTTIDAVDGLSTLQEFDEAEEQAAVADLLVVTKLDLLPEAGQPVLRLKSRLSALNPFAAITLAHDAAAALFPPVRLNSLQTSRATQILARLEAANSCSSHHHHRHGSGECSDDGAHDIHTTAFLEERPISFDFLRLFLETIARDAGRGLLRVKGLINVAERPGKPAVINGARGVPHSIEWLAEWPDADKRSRLVVITRGIVPERLTDAWRVVERFAGRPTVGSSAS